MPRSMPRWARPGRLVAAAAGVAAALLLALPVAPDDGRGPPTAEPAPPAPRASLPSQDDAPAAATAALTSTGTPEVRADPARDRELARLNRELLLETNIGRLESAAHHARAQGNPQRAALMARRVAALEAQLGELRGDPDR